MWTTAAYLVLSFREPLFTFVAGSRLLQPLRSGIRSLDVMERFEMETRLQVLQETLEAEHERRLDAYTTDVEV